MSKSDDIRSDCTTFQGGDRVMDRPANLDVTYETTADLAEKLKYTE